MDVCKCVQENGDNRECPVHSVRAAADERARIVAWLGERNLNPDKRADVRYFIDGAERELLAKAIDSGAHMSGEYA